MKKKFLLLTFYWAAAFANANDRFADLSTTEIDFSDIELPFGARVKSVANPVFSTNMVWLYDEFGIGQGLISVQFEKVGCEKRIIKPNRQIWELKLNISGFFQLSPACSSIRRYLKLSKNNRKCIFYGCNSDKNIINDAHILALETHYNGEITARQTIKMTFSNGDRSIRLTKGITCSLLKVDGKKCGKVSALHNISN